MSDFREEEKLGKLYDSQLTHRLDAIPASVPAAGGGGAVVHAGNYRAGNCWVRYLFHVGIDKFIVPGFQGDIARKIALMGLVWVALAYAGSILASFGLQYVQVRIMQWVGQKTMYDLRREIFSHLQRLPMSFFDRSPIGRLVTRSTTDVDALNDLFASGVVAMLNDFFLLIAMAVVLFKWNRPLAFATFSPLPFMILLTYIFRNKVRDANRRIRTAIAAINAYLQEHVSGMAIVQLFNREKKSRKRFEELNRTHMIAYKDAIDAFSFFYPGVEFLSMSGIALLSWVGGTRVITGTIEIGVIDRVHDVRAAVLPADSGFEREIQYFAECDGGFGENFPAAG